MQRVLQLTRCIVKDRCGADLASKFVSYSRNNSSAEVSLARKMSYTIIERGTPNTLDYRVFFSGPNGIISPFHDIPLVADDESQTFNMVVEVPRWTNAKMEIDTKNALNPIKQDVKKGKLRFVDNCFPHHGYIWNYGALPQTWEDPSKTDEHTGKIGDNDPIDVCEIGQKVHKRGAVVQVKVLGCFALIDEGETDWKILAIDVKDPLADKLNGINDIEQHMPGFLKATHEWFKIYKIPTGKPANEFAFKGAAKDREFALQIVHHMHSQWQDLMTERTDNPGVALENTKLDNSHTISQQDGKTLIEMSPPLGDPAPIDPAVDKWNYVQLYLS